MTETKEEIFSNKIFEWVKTERAGDISYFSRIENIDGVEYIIFSDNTRVRADLVGDVVLVHENENSVLNLSQQRESVSLSPLPPLDSMAAFAASQGIPIDGETVHPTQPSNVRSQEETNPVMAILEKTKKRNEKLNLEITIKLPSPEVIEVLRNNFDDVDKSLVFYVMKQIEGAKIEAAVKNSINQIYNKKQK
jgi:hypothetical protein